MARPRPHRSPAAVVLGLGLTVAMLSFHGHRVFGDAWPGLVESAWELGFGLAALLVPAGMAPLLWGSGRLTRFRRRVDSARGRTSDLLSFGGRSVRFRTRLSWMGWRLRPRVALGLRGVLPEDALFDPGTGAWRAAPGLRRPLLTAEQDAALMRSAPAARVRMERG